MGIFSGVKKDPIGTVSTINDIADIATSVGEAGVAAANNNRVEEAKALSNALLGVYGALNPVPGSGFAGDIAAEGVNHAIDALANRQKQIDDAVDAATGGSGSGGGENGAGNGSGGTDNGGGAAGGTGTGGAGSGANGTTPPRRDPLVFDLDSDGIETTSTRDGTVILFDHDADGIKTGTGWVKPDDGWLVLDRNGNGTIDSGRELFGVDTLKSNGTLAKDGFDALKDFDANNDGKITSTDSAFSNLRIWRDLNQDGISQAGELSSLSSNSIVSIGVNASAVRNDLGNGNIQTAAGTFTRSNGTTGTTGETDSATANLDLLVNTFYREFTDHITLTDQAKALPELKGSGQVRDLSEAISLSSTLGDYVQTYSEQTTRDAQISRLDGFIEQWANTSSMKSLKAQADALAGNGVSLTYNLAGLTAGSAEYNAFIQKLGVVERFMGFTYGGANGQARFTALDSSSGNLTVNLAAEQISNISLAYDRFKTDIYESLLTRTRLEPYVLAMAQGISWDDTSAWIDSSIFEQTVQTAIDADPRNGLIDLIEFTSAIGKQTLDGMNWDIQNYIIDQINSNPELGAFTEELSSWTVRFAAATEHNVTGTSRADFLVGTDGNDYLYGRDDNDVILGKSGNDTLYGEAGNDTLDGGTGNDTLNGGTGADTYKFGFGYGQDTVYNYDADGVGNSADTILLGNGITTTGVKLTRSSDDLIISLVGRDDTLRVQSYFNTDGNSNYALENLKFADGTIWDINTIKTKVMAGTSGDDTLYGYATADTINGLDGNDTLYGNAGDDILDGGNGNDSVQGGDGNDTLAGNTGNDYVYGGNGNDSLTGASGNDTINGDAGNDTLDGGTGNDTLNGGTGADTYKFGFGYGQDTVYNYDADGVGNSADTILLGNGITTTGVKLTRSSDDLIISLVGRDDTLRVQSYFNTDGNSNYALENLKFADGTIWDYATVKANLDTTTPPAGVTVNGTSASETLTGGAGNDTLYGNAGNDTLDGGTGNDSLNGGAGNDTFLFNRGYGKDTVNAYDSNAGKVDVIQLGANIATTDVTLTRESNDLLISLNNSSDSVRVQSYFYNDATYGYQVEQIKFNDGTIWDINTVKAKVTVGTNYNDTLYGYNTADTLSGGFGTDTLYGRGGNDTLDGGDSEDSLYGEDGDDTLKGGNQNDRLDGGNGNDTLQGQNGDDTLYGQEGNDSLDGGTGNDSLNGGAGNDTFLFNRGYGKDTVNAYDSNAGKVDAIQLGANIATTDVTLTRESNDLLIALNNSSDSVRVQSYFYNDATYGYQVEQIKFNDGTIWDINTVKAKVTVGTNYNDTLYGYNTADTLSGGFGTDTLYGRGGNDTLDGGDSEDSLYGEDGDDTLKGGNQNDRLDGGNGNDTLQGQNGDDTLYGQEGNDSLDGGTGNDSLNGGAGNDTFLFNRGYGKDTVNAYDSNAGKVDAIQLGANIATTDVTLTRESNDLLIALNNSSDSVRVQSYFYNDATYGYQVEQIKFNDGTIWDINTVKAKVTVGTNYNDTLYGYNTADTLSGGFGTDTLYGRGGNDTLDGGDSEDSLYGEDGDDTLKGGNQNDRLDGGNGNDTLQGQNGDDTLYGQEGNDSLDGGSGNDYLSGGNGNDTYLFGKSANNDILYNYDTSGGNDRVQIGSGVTEGQIWFQRTGNDLQLTLIETNDKLTVQSWYSGANYHLDGFNLSNGKHLEEAQVDALVSAMAAFAPPSAGQTALPADYQTALNPVIAANWQ
jgi:Ca2+-binding RTX toxin-like protein